MEYYYHLSNKNYKNALYVFLAIIYIFIIYFLLLQKDSNLSYNTSDWLVNYEDGGFKRRGLGGSILFFISDLININLKSLVFWMEVLLYSSFFILLVLLIPTYLNIGLFLILISPLCLGYYFVEASIIGKKEILLFSLFTYFNLNLLKSKINFKIELLIILLLIIITLIHELTIFYIPYFLIALYLHDKRTNNKRFLIYISAVFIPVLFLHLFGSKINNGNSILLLESKGIIAGGYGIFDHDESTNFLTIYLRDIELYSLYIIPIIIGILLVNLYLYLYFHNFNSQFNYTFFIIFIYSLPLFYLANDWGRWINIHFTLIAIILLTFYSGKHIKFPKFTYLAIPILFIWGYSILGKGFHFNTYFNYIILSKLLRLDYSFY